MEKNIKDYLHLYLGCRAKVIMAENSQSELPYYFSEDGIYKIEGVMLDFQSECESIKPILHPLSAILSIPIEQKRQLLDAGLMYSHRGDEYTIWTPEAIRLACSFGVDIFGLIDAGLAIDATTIKPEAPEEPCSPPKVKNADGTDHIQVA